jgi:hypothetical protein
VGQAPAGSLRGRLQDLLAGRLLTQVQHDVRRQGVPHDWWNAGPGEGLVRVEVRPADRFEAFIANAFGLAQDGKVNPRGVPNLLQLAVIAREFDDVIRFTRPPRLVQRALFGLLAPLAWLLGYRGSYSEYLTRGPSASVTVEPMDIATALAAGLAVPSAEPSP